MRFEPTALRYLKLGAFCRASPHFNVWRFREAYFYERADGSGRPNEQEAGEIARELQRAGVDLAICDEWLSRKIEQTDDPHPNVFPRWEYRFPESQVSRVVPVRAGVAVVVENAHADATEQRLRNALPSEVRISRHPFAHYTAFVFEEAPAECASFPGLLWNGFAVVNAARIATADWIYRYGISLDQRNRPDEALRCFERSFALFPGIDGNLRRLAGSDARASAVLDTLTPEVSAFCRFAPGVSLVGYTLTPSRLAPGGQARLQLVWELDGSVKQNFLQVFVHFRDDKRRVFQTDHNVPFPVEAGESVPRVLVLDEHEFRVPDDVPPGELVIYVGATSTSDRSVRLRPRTKLHVWNRAVRIGHAEVTR
jgi:hypothetical protein